MAKTGEPTAEKKAKAKTEYHVLCLRRGSDPVTQPPTEYEGWEIVATLMAGSSAQAKRTYFDSVVKDATTEVSESLVAVPTSSWNPDPYRAVPQMKIVVG